MSPKKFPALDARQRHILEQELLQSQTMSREELGSRGIITPAAKSAL